MRLLPRRRALTALAAAVALLAAGCGVQDTGVIGAGRAPMMGTLGSTLGRLTLYFMLDGQLTPVQRPWGEGWASPTTAVQQLFEGPNPDELRAGYVSLLPTSHGLPVTVAMTGDSPTVVVPYPLQKLSPGGMNQIACTTVAALTAAGDLIQSGRVILSGPDMTNDQLVCGVG